MNETAEPFRMENVANVCLLTTRRLTNEKWYEKQKKCCVGFLVVWLLPPNSDTNQSTVEEDEEPICAQCMVHMTCNYLQSI